MPTITLQGRAVPYRLIQSRRNRHIRLTVAMSTGLRVSVPPRFPVQDVPSIIRERAAWVLRKLDEYADLERSFPRQRYRHGSRIMYLGRSCLLRLRPSRNGHARVRHSNRTVDVALPANQGLDSREERVRAIVHRWYRSQAQELIAARAAEIAAGMRVRPGRITIRKQRSRWGSCTAEGHLNFNQLLMMAPPNVIDYVIVHELAHLHELNHSPRYWKIVERWCPDLDACRNWLKEHIYYLDQ
jgi:predicted metal-dependent hydrolase